MGVAHLNDLAVGAPSTWVSQHCAPARDICVQIQADRAAALTGQAGNPTVPPDPVAIGMQQTHDLITQADRRGHAAAPVSAATTAARHDGFILAYRGLYDSMIVRPITGMQQTDPTETLASETPPTPSSPCDTTVVSVAAATVLMWAFPGAQDALDAPAVALRVAGVPWSMDGAAGNGLGEALGRRLARRIESMERCAWVPEDDDDRPME